MVESAKASTDFSIIRKLMKLLSLFSWKLCMNVMLTTSL
jgi:hypothetical protein